jgi:EmrB/QacA subfamily drug resistance transporter
MNVAAFDPPTGARLRVVTGALMLSLFLAATETTFVTAAMPTIVTQLGGLGAYSWVFSGFMLSLTASIAVFGKLSDLLGRRRVYLVAMSVFLVASLLCGVARSMTELIVYRIVQGIGAGGLSPLIFAIIGDIYSLDQRARVQGLFASVWGVSSILGPVVGGLLVDGLSWRWVFVLNVPIGAVATAVLMLAWRDPQVAERPRIDYAGAAVLVSSIVCLLLALLELDRPGGWRSASTWLLVCAAPALVTLLWRVERAAHDPIVPVRLFRERLFLVACGQAFSAGFAVFGSLTFIPLFVQFGTGVGATQAGASLLPLLLPWVVASNVGSRLILRLPFRTVALLGTSSIAVGLAGVTVAGIGSSRSMFVLSTSLIGIGMGLSSPVFLIAVQTSMPRATLGTATSTLQLARSIGTAIGVTIMGAILSLQVGQRLEGGRDTVVPAELRASLGVAQREVFAVALLAGIASLAFTTLAPRGRLGRRGEQRLQRGAEPWSEVSAMPGS